MIKVKLTATGEILGDFVKLKFMCDETRWHPSTGHEHITMVVIKSPEWYAPFTKRLNEVSFV